MTAYETATKAESASKSSDGGVGDRLAAGAEAVRKGAAGLSQDVQSAVAGAKDAGRDTIERAREGAARLKSTVQEQSQKVQSGYRYMVDENPLVIAVVGFAVGAILAACFPRTRHEEELLGEASNKALHAVQTGIGTVAEKAATLARSAVGSMDTGLDAGQQGNGSKAGSDRPDRQGESSAFQPVEQR